jgi:hypothetical protein
MKNKEFFPKKTMDANFLQNIVQNKILTEIPVEFNNVKQNNYKKLIKIQSSRNPTKML